MKEQTWQERFDEQNFTDAWAEDESNRIKQFISDLVAKTREETIVEERKRIYDYVEERLIGDDNELLKDLSNIIFNKTN